MIESEVKKQIGSVWGSSQMAQQFDDVLENYMQDLYLDCTEVMEESLQKVPTPFMEDGTSNTPRSIWMGMNEWQAGHITGGTRDGLFPGITQIENYDPTDAPNGKMAAQVQFYGGTGPTTAANSRNHLFRAVSEGLRRVNYKAVPLAENYSDATEGFSEAFGSLEMIMLIQSTLASHDSVIAEDGVNGVYSIESRFKGLQLIDVPELETLGICPSYSAAETPSTTAFTTLYDAGAREQSYYTELTSPNAVGPRLYVPYQPHCRPIWDDDSFMRKSPLYMLDETVPDAMVCWLENFRNLHFERLPTQPRHRSLGHHHGLLITWFSKTTWAALSRSSRSTTPLPGPAARSRSPRARRTRVVSIRSPTSRRTPQRWTTSARALRTARTASWWSVPARTPSRLATTVLAWRAVRF